MASSEVARKPARAPGSAPRATHTLAAMLGHSDRDHGQLFDLVARRLTQRYPVAFAEHIAAVTARRPMVDQLIDRPRRQKWAPVTLMPRLPAKFAT